MQKMIPRFIFLRTRRERNDLSKLREYHKFISISFFFSNSCINSVLIALLRHISRDSSRQIFPVWTDLNAFPRMRNSYGVGFSRVAHIKDILYLSRDSRDALIHVWERVEIGFAAAWFIHFTFLVIVQLSTPQDNSIFHGASRWRMIYHILTCLT